VEVKRIVNGREYTFIVGFEHKNVPSKRWVAYCRQLGFEEVVGSSFNEVLHKLESKVRLAG
jgi:hypothetical protein